MATAGDTDSLKVHRPSITDDDVKPWWSIYSKTVREEATATVWDACRVNIAHYMIPDFFRAVGGRTRSPYEAVEAYLFADSITNDFLDKLAVRFFNPPNTQYKDLDLHSSVVLYAILWTRRYQSAAYTSLYVPSRALKKSTVRCVVDALLRRGLGLSHSGPLALCCYFDAEDFAHSLMDLPTQPGLNINWIHEKGYTLLMMAVHMGNQSFSLMSRLIECTNHAILNYLRPCEKNDHQFDHRMNPLLVIVRDMSITSLHAHICLAKLRLMLMAADEDGTRVEVVTLRTQNGLTASEYAKSLKISDTNDGALEQKMSPYVNPTLDVAAKEIDIVVARATRYRQGFQAALDDAILSSMFNIRGLVTHVKHYVLASFLW